MRIVKIEVSYGLTESMNYDNVRVQETRVAELDGKEDWNNDEDLVDDDEEEDWDPMADERDEYPVDPNA